MATFHVEMTEAEREDLRVLAAEHDRSASSMVRELIRRAKADRDRMARLAAMAARASEAKR